MADDTAKDWDDEAVRIAGCAINAEIERMLQALPDGVEAAVARERLAEYVENWPELQKWQAAHEVLTELGLT